MTSNSLFRPFRVDLTEVSDMIELPDGVRLIVLIEGRPPTSYCCEQRRHIKKKFPQNPQEEMKKEEEYQSEPVSFTKSAQKTQESTKVEEEKEKIWRKKATLKLQQGKEREKIPHRKMQSKEKKKKERKAAVKPRHS